MRTAVENRSRSGMFCTKKYGTLDRDYICGNFSKRARIFMFLTPYYQYWPAAGSNQIILTGNAPAREPGSRTDIYGADAGLGVNFQDSLETCRPAAR